MSNLPINLVPVVAAACLISLLAAADPPASAIRVTARTRSADQVVETPRDLDPAKTAVVICDMWDDHWCVPAAKRCDALARKAAPVIAAARAKGMTVIHCPSDCMTYYADHPARKRALAVKLVAPPPPKDLPNPPLPIDDSDGGCDSPAPTPFRKAWTKQHDAIVIDAGKDYVTDSGKEVYSILAARGATTVLVMGVHTNMCVLNRTFAIKQLRRWGVDCLLVRDLTDAMYNPQRRPFVSHDEGTQLVVGHIEAHWCPSVESKGLIAAEK